MFTLSQTAFAEDLDTLKKDTFKGKTIMIEGIRYDQETNRKFTGIIFNFGGDKNFHTRVHYKNGLLAMYESFDDVTPYQRFRYKNALDNETSKDHRDGLQEVFHNNGQLQWRWNVRMGVKEGKEENFYDNGMIESIASYKQGKVHGLVKEFNERGIKIFETTYQRGFPKGDYKTFYDDGTLEVKAKIEPCNLENPRFKNLTEENFSNYLFCSIDDGLFTEYTHYDESGNTLKDIVYSENFAGTERETLSVFQKHTKGEKTDFNGEIKFYDKDTRIRSILTYKDGDFNGPVILYHDRYGYSTEDYIVSRGSFKDGEEDGVFEEFSESGKLVSRINYSKGRMHGLWETFHENGSLKSRGMFKEGGEEGEWVGYYPDGQLHRRDFYVNGKREGLYEIFHPNGKIQSRHDWKDGNLVGEWKKFDEQGNPIK
jgi:antitoxin component YwqK of YwqJK toxin-antitoxin module